MSASKTSLAIAIVHGIKAPERRRGLATALIAAADGNGKLTSRPQTEDSEVVTAKSKLFANAYLLSDGPGSCRLDPAIAAGLRQCLVSEQGFISGTPDGIRRTA